MAEWSKALVLGTSLRAWVRIPLQSRFIFFSPGRRWAHLLLVVPRHLCRRSYTKVPPQTCQLLSPTAPPPTFSSHTIRTLVTQTVYQTTKLHPLLVELRAPNEYLVIHTSYLHSFSVRTNVVYKDVIELGEPSNQSGSPSPLWWRPPTYEQNDPYSTNIDRGHSRHTNYQIDTRTYDTGLHDGACVLTRVPALS
jgi:hypothetical protein